MDIKRLRNKIWFTYIARIETTKRLKLWDKTSEILLVWYSLITVLGSGFSLIVKPDFLKDQDTTNFLLLASSIAVLVISLFTTGQNLKSRAIYTEFNYKKLQRLYNKSANGYEYQKLQNEYDDIIAESENHSSYDYDKARYHHTKFVVTYCQPKLESSLDDSNKMLMSDYVWCIVRFYLFGILILLGFIAPLLLLIWFV